MSEPTDDQNEILLYKGDILYNTGDETDFAYLIKRGKINLYRKIDGESILDQSLQTGDLLGAVDIIQKCPRMFTATAGEYTTLVKIEPKVLNVIYKDSLPIVKTMLTQLSGRIQDLEASYLPLKKKEKLADHLTALQASSDESSKKFMKKEFRKGEFIFQKGEDSNCAYRIRNGSVDIIFDDAQEGVKVETLQAGDLFGELGAVSGEPREYSAKAGDICELERIDRITLNNMIQGVHPVIRGVMHTIIEKLQAVEEKIAQFSMFDNTFLILTTFIFRQATEGDDTLKQTEATYNIKGMASQKRKKIDKVITLGEITNKVKEILLQLRAMHLIDIEESENTKCRSSARITVKDIRLFLKKARQAYDKYLVEIKNK